MVLQNKKWYDAVVCRSPSQSTSELDHFISSIYLDSSILITYNSNPYFTIILGNFNARSKSWWSKDINVSEGSQSDVITSSYASNKLYPNQHQILENSSSSQINPILLKIVVFLCPYTRTAIKLPTVI